MSYRVCHKSTGRYATISAQDWPHRFTSGQRDGPAQPINQADSPSSDGYTTISTGEIVRTVNFSRYLPAIALPLLSESQIATRRNDSTRQSRNTLRNHIDDPYRMTYTSGRRTMAITRAYGHLPF